MGSSARDVAVLMDWPYLVRKYDLKRRVTGVFHAGAHTCEERDSYNELGVPVWWVEANPNLYPEIEQNLGAYPDQHLIRALLFDKEGEDVTLNISGPDYRGSSSVLPWGTHRTFSPLVWVDKITARSKTINGLWSDHEGFPGVNMIATDLQGADLLVLSAAEYLLAQCDFVMCEVNVVEVYVGAGLLPDLDALLASAGFERAETHMVGNQGWGDGFWHRVRPR